MYYFWGKISRKFVIHKIFLFRNFYKDFVWVLFIIYVNIKLQKNSIQKILHSVKNANFAFANKGPAETRDWRISSPFESASGISIFDPDGIFLAYSAMPKLSINRQVADGNCSVEEEEFEKKPMLEQLLNYRKFYDGMDIYKFNAFGQMLHPITKRKGRQA
jgi:hypothetical protein